MHVWWILPTWFGTVIAIGVGLILVRLNLVRITAGDRNGKFSLAIRIVALLIRRYLGATIDMVAMMIILMGLFIVAGAIARR